MNKMALQIGVALLTIATPATAADQPPAGDFECMANLMGVRAGAKKMSEDAALAQDKRDRAKELLADADEALAYYLGRISLLPADATVQERAKAAFDRLFATPNKDRAAESIACIVGATEARAVVVRRFKLTD